MAETGQSCACTSTCACTSAPVILPGHVRANQTYLGNPHQDSYWFKLIIMNKNRTRVAGLHNEEP